MKINNLVKLLLVTAYFFLANPEAWSQATPQKPLIIKQAEITEYEFGFRTGFPGAVIFYQGDKRYQIGVSTLGDAKALIDLLKASETIEITSNDTSEKFVIVSSFNLKIKK